MSDLHTAQALHVKLVGRLIEYIYLQGYECTWGEAYRTPQQAQWDAAHGTGIAESVHCDRLAVDLQLFKNGVYLTNATDYTFAGEFWESLDPSCRWGGRFTTVDADHFSITWQGRS